jgi:hypothetical protein
MTVLDAKTAKILERWLDESRWYPHEEEYPGDPEIRPETQWRLLHQYFDQDMDALMASMPQPPADRIGPIEALALARLLSDGIRMAYWGLIYEARKAGDSWADIGAALGVTRQSAHEMYAKDLDAYAAKNAGSSLFDRAEYESVLDDRTAEQ